MREDDIARGDSAPPVRAPTLITIDTRREGGEDGTRRSRGGGLERRGKGEGWTTNYSVVRGVFVCLFVPTCNSCPLTFLPTLEGFA